MRNIFLYGAGNAGRKFLQNLLNDRHGKQVFNILGFIDKNPRLHNTEVCGLRVYALDDVRHMDVPPGTSVLVTTSFQGRVILEDLLNSGFDEEHIDFYTARYALRIRDDFLRTTAEIVTSLGIPGNVAEVGVFNGDFAVVMNEVFPERKLYLFDTFEGFDEAQWHSDMGREYTNRFYAAAQFQESEFHISKFPYPDKLIIRKGFFPDTAEGIADTFAFVNLDLDLYQPTLDGLKFFYPLMAKGGTILVHDFFNEDFNGIRQAVNEFCSAAGLTYNAIGDSISVAITKAS